SEFPPAIFLTMRKDLGDVSRGKLVTVDNFQEIFAGILNAKDLEGMRLLVTQFPQQQFNATADRKTERPDGMQGVACFDCHVNGHTSGATHQVGDKLTAGHVIGIGAVSDAVVGYFEPAKKTYLWLREAEQLEVLSLTGNLALNHDAPFSTS